MRFCVCGSFIFVVLFLYVLYCVFFKFDVIPVFVLVLNVDWKCHNTLCLSMVVFHLSYLMQNVFPVNKKKWWIGHNLLNEI
jgi:hypothetical protein